MVGATLSGRCHAGWARRRCLGWWSCCSPSATTSMPIPTSHARPRSNTNSGNSTRGAGIQQQCSSNSSGSVQSKHQRHCQSTANHSAAYQVHQYQHQGPRDATPRSRRSRHYAAYRVAQRHIADHLHEQHHLRRDERRHEQQVKALPLCGTELLRSINKHLSSH